MAQQIRFAQEEDIPALCTLWQSAFQEEEAALRLFFERRFIPENTLLILEGSIPVSALYLLEGSVRGGMGEDFSAYYIYAAATHEKHRSKGYMGSLLTRAQELACERGKEYLCLAPAQAGLFAYYARFGFEAVFTQKRLIVSRRQLRLMARQGAQSGPEPDAALLAALRAEALLGQAHFIWDEAAIAYALRQHALYGGRALYVWEGEQLRAFALFLQEAEKCIVSECCCRDVRRDFPLLADCLTRETPQDVFFFRLPLPFPLSADQFEVTENAMLLPLTPRAVQAKQGLRDAYMGLTLE